MSLSGMPLSSPPVFSGENYIIWAVKMESYLHACDLWDVVETESELSPLPNNPTLAQIKSHREEKARRYKAKTCIHAAVSESVFTRIMACETAKQA